MKRRIGIITLLLACLGLLAACQSFKPDQLSMADIAVVDGAGKTVVSYGMPRETVEKTLGPGSEDEDMKWVIYEEARLSVWYRDGLAVGFICSNPEYASPRGLQVGMPAKAVREQYGNKTLNRMTGSVAGGKSFVYGSDTRRKKPLDVTQKPAFSEELKKQAWFTALLDEESSVVNFSAVDGMMGNYLQ